MACSVGLRGRIGSPQQPPVEAWQFNDLQVDKLQVQPTLTAAELLRAQGSVCPTCGAPLGRVITPRQQK